METHHIPNEQEVVNQVYDHAAYLLIKEKMSPADAIQELVYKGLPQESAEIVVNNIYDEIKKAKKQRASKDMLYGFLWLAGGSIITALTYIGAQDGGGVYFVFWGAIIFGGYQFLRGLFGSI